jgi:pimeloyl-ACP methyl ester carboxylesterase
MAQLLLVLRQRMSRAWAVDSIWTDFTGCGVKETYIDAAGTRTRVLEAGDGAPLGDGVFPGCDPAAIGVVGARSGRDTEELVDIRYKIYKQPGMVEHMVTLMCTVFEMNRTCVGDVDYYAHSLSDLKCPALVIWTDHNPGKSFDVVKPAIDAIPEKEVHLLNGAAHWSQWEKPSEVNVWMIEFLTRFSKETHNGAAKSSKDNAVRASETPR